LTQPVLTDAGDAVAARPAAFASRRVLVFFFSACGATAAIIYWLQALRMGRFDPQALPIFYSLFIFQDYLPALTALGLLAAALVPGVGAFGMRLASICGDRPITVAGITTVCLSAGALLVYRNHPLSMDEYAAAFQGKVFATGHLTGRFPVPLMDWLVPPGFQNQFLTVSHESGAVASIYLPGFALLLAPFTWLSIPWAANAIVGGVTVLLVHRLALELLGSRQAAGLAVLLTLASPAVTINAMSYYSMPAHLAANAAFALLLLRPTPRRALAAGVVGSFALVLHNPVPHILFAIPWGIWLLAGRERRLNVLFLLIGYLPLCIVIGIGWPMFLHTLHDADGVAASTQAAGSTVLGQWLASLRSVLVLPSVPLLVARIIGTAKIWIWAVPGLLLLACVGAFKERRNVRLMLLAASALTTLIGYTFVPFDQGHGWGFRYFHSAWFALPLLAAAAVVKIDGQQAPQMRAYVAGLAALSLVFLTAIHASNVQNFIDAQRSQMPAVAGITPQVLIVNSRAGYYAGDLVQNDPLLRTKPIVLISHGQSDDEQVMKQNFPGLQRVYKGPHGTAWAPSAP